MLTTIKKWVTGVALIKQIALGLIIGIVIALFFQPVIPVVKIFGDLFVKALKGVAPVLVFFLVMNAMAQKKESKENSIQPIIELYMIATFCASLVGVGMSFLFPTTLNLTVAPDAKLAPPSGIVEVLHTLILSIVDNPVSALMNANYIGILAWAVILGIALRSVAGEVTRTCLNDIAASANVSPAYLSALFKKNQGISLSDFITSQRISAAARYLTTTTMSLKEISLKCGYANQYYFSTSFKKKMGITPSAYREQHT